MKTLSKSDRSVEREAAKNAKRKGTRDRQPGNIAADAVVVRVDKERRGRKCKTSAQEADESEAMAQRARAREAQEKSIARYGE